jgi:hypothetical protein
VAEDRYVRTQHIRDAVRGRETEVLKALGIARKEGASHSHCPYPNHNDANPSWRWDQAKARAFCSCIDGSHTILDVVAHCEGVDFEVAKVRVAEILGRQDLIKEKGSRRHQGMDAASLLRPTAEERNDELVPAYLAYRLGVEPSDVPLPSTPVVGRCSLPYYDLPENGGRSTLVGGYPGVIFGTASPDGRTHAQRIYVKANGKGKADLGVGRDGRQRDAKKAAKLPRGVTSAGCAILWGDPSTAPHLILAEGPETTAALALAHKAELTAGKVALAAALSTGGIRSFRPWPANRQVTVAADRDEAKPEADRGFKAGEKAARDFARKYHQHLEVRIAVPGLPGADVDWLDVLRTDGIEAVRAGIATAEAFVPPPQDSAEPDADAGSPDPEQIERGLVELVERARTDPGAPFEQEAVVALASARHATPAVYQRAMRGLKQAGTRMRDLDHEIRRANLRVIEGGGGSSGFEATIEAGPYFVTPDGIVAWRKETREGVVNQPLCNFSARIVAEEVLDDGAEQHTVFVIEGELPGGHRLPPTRVPAERYPAMNWVTEAWGMAPVIFAGQGKRDHLRVAIQMLSGAVPRRTVYGHLGWRPIDGRWVFLHQGAGIGPDGAIGDVEVEAGVDGLLAYDLPEPPAADEVVAATEASLAVLELGADTVTAPLLGAVYRAPLGEAALIDFSVHLTGPTGVFKSELAAVAQAHFGAGFNSRRLPASWADTANMLEKKAFLAKDAVLVVDDFAPTGTTADVQRLHREADRLFRGAGNRSGRARMRADGAGRPTYHSRGLIVSTGEDIPSGQSLRARMIVLELAPGDIDAGVLSVAQRNAVDGVLATAMAGYLRWLASRIDDLRRTLPERQRALRDEFVRQGQHKRTPEVAASIMIGWETFLGFAQEVGALPRHSVEVLLERVRAAVLDSAATQAGYQSSEEPAARFLALLGAAISSGRAHVTGAGDGGAPDEADRWGWHVVIVGAGNQEREDWRPRGERIGWLDADDLFLDPESSFAAVQKLARDQGTSVPIKQRTLWKRLAEQGHLVSRDRARRTNTVRRTIGGRRLEVIHLKASTFAVETDQPTAETAQTDQQPAEKGQQNQCRGQFGQFGQKMKQGGPEEHLLRDAVGWEIEI